MSCYKTHPVHRVYSKERSLYTLSLVFSKTPFTLQNEMRNKSSCLLFSRWNSANANDPNGVRKMFAKRSFFPSRWALGRSRPLWFLLSSFHRSLRYWNYPRRITLYCDVFVAWFLNQWNLCLHQIRQISVPVHQRSIDSKQQSFDVQVLTGVTIRDKWYNRKRRRVFQKIKRSNSNVLNVQT